MNIHPNQSQFIIFNQDLDAERAVIARGLVSPDDLAEIASKLTFADFDHPFLARCFDAMRGLAGEGRKPSVESLVGAFGNDEIEPGLTVRQCLTDMVRGSLYGQFLPLGDAVGVVKENSQRRLISGVGADLVSGAFGGYSVAAIVLNAVDRLDEVSSSNRQSVRHVHDAGSVADVAIANLDAKDRPSPTTGLVDLDKKLGGWPKGEMSVVAGRPGMGKSAVATTALLRAAKARHGCLFFSLEMTAKQLGARMLTDIAYTHASPIFYQDILTRNVDDHQRRRLESAREFLRQLPIVIEEQRGLSISDIAARSRKVSARFLEDGGSLDVVFVDHMLLVKPSQRYAGNRVREVAEISDGLACLAKELNTAVVALCQLNRGVEGRDIKRPTLSDLRDSGAIEEDASTVTFIYRPAYYLEQTRAEGEAEIKRLQMLDAQRNTLEFIVAKNRNGQVGIVDAFVEIGANAVRDKAYGG